MESHQEISKGAVVVLSLDKVFHEFQKSCLNSKIVMQYKQDILQQACDNLNLPYAGHDPAEIKAIEKELKNMIYADGCGLPHLFHEGDEFEADKDSPEQKGTLDHNIIARNVLRYIFRGVPIDPSDARYKRGLAFVRKNLETEKDPKFLAVIRAEMKRVLKNICDQVASEKEEKEAIPVHFNKEQFKIFLSNFLSAYTFMDPDVDTLTIPQEIPGLGWTRVTYQVNKLDISPQTGILSYLLEDKDRMYAYTLTPCAGSPTRSVSHLLLMGTTYDTGQGSELAALYNFYPRHSVGEAHELSLVDDWIAKEAKLDRKIQITGHSKGATMAMIVAARHSKHVVRADCLNPTALCHATLDRLLPAWLAQDKDSRPEINVYAQAGDPVFPLENAFLPGTHIYRIFADTTTQVKNALPAPIDFFVKIFQSTLEAHIHHFAGRKNLFIIKVNEDSQNYTLKREFLADVKGGLNWVLFPTKYLHLAGLLTARKILLPAAIEDKESARKTIYSGVGKLNSASRNLVSGALGASAIAVSGSFSGAKVTLKFCNQNINRLFNYRNNTAISPVAEASQKKMTP